MKQALYVDSISSVTGSFIGRLLLRRILNLLPAFPLAVVPSDGSGCWSAVPAGYLPIAAAGMVPGYAAAGALIYVGVLMPQVLLA